VGVSARQANGRISVWLNGPCDCACCLVLIAGGIVPVVAAPESLQDRVHADFAAGRAADAAALLQQEAARGDREAQYGLGVLYEKGLEEAKIAQDESQAFHWYSHPRRGAMRRHRIISDSFITRGGGRRRTRQRPRAGMKRPPSRGTPSPSTTSARCTFTAAESRKIYQRLLTFTRDRPNRATWRRRTTSGLCTSMAWAWPRDFREAVRWYERAARAAKTTRREIWRRCMKTASGPAAIIPGPFPGTEKAAAQGHAHAQLKLGRLYEHGWGASKDLIEACAWYWAASQRGNARAAEALARVIPQLSSSQVSEARDRASRFSLEAPPDENREPAPGDGHRPLWALRALRLRHSRRRVCQPRLQRSADQERRRAAVQRCHPGQPGSGAVVADVFEKYLFSLHYAIVDPAQAQAVVNGSVWEITNTSGANACS